MADDAGARLLRQYYPDVEGALGQPAQQSITDWLLRQPGQGSLDALQHGSPQDVAHEFMQMVGPFGMARAPRPLSRMPPVSTDVNPRIPALNDARETMYAAQGDMFSHTLPGDLRNAAGTGGGPAHEAYLALLQASGDVNAALQAASPEARNVINYWRQSGANLHSFADPARAHRFWQGRDQFDTLERPMRLNSPAACSTSTTATNPKGLPWAACPQT